MKISIIGSGYVGLVSGACFAEFGVDVTCIDKDKNKIKNLKKGIIPIYEPGLEDLVKKNLKEKRINFETNLAESIKGSSAVFIAVGTPERRGDGHADLTFVYEVAKELAKSLNHYAVIVNKSTVPIGTGKKVYEIIEENKKNKELKFDVASNPEFLREGSAINDFMRPDRVVIGCEEERPKKILEELYRPLYLLETPILFTKRETAELIKYAANSFLATKISFINEMSDLCEKVGGNVQSVAKGMGLDNRIGQKFLHPGPGFGGSCFPKDTRALHSSFKKNGVKSDLVKSVINFNESRKINMFKKVKKMLKGDLKNKKVAFLGVTFKPNTDDLRESPSLVIISKLVAEGAKVNAHDPAFNQTFKNIKEFKKVFWHKSVFKAITGADILVIHTEWNEYRALDLKAAKKMLLKPLIVDFRNIFNIKNFCSFIICNSFFSVNFTYSH